MRYQFFANSQKSWQAMYEAISSAQTSIYLEMYIFSDDMTDYNFLKLLEEKALRGLRVRVVLDSFGSANLSKKVIEELRYVGVELIFLSYFLNRTHRKILIVDEHVAFIGGVNFHQSASLWNDLMVKVEGKLVYFITKSFAKVYAECGGKDPLVLMHNKAKFKKKMHDWLIEHFPIKNKYRLKKIYQRHLSRAHENVILVTPYLMPKRWLIGSLHQAVLRGVRVEILIPKNTDHYFIDRVNYFFMYELSKLGVNIHMESQMNHAKLMVIDKKEAIVGSNNLDFLSFELNSEVGIFFKDVTAVREILKIINKWEKDTEVFDKKAYHMKWFDYVLYPVISLFFRIL